MIFPGQWQYILSGEMQALIEPLGAEGHALITDEDGNHFRDLRATSEIDDLMQAGGVMRAVYNMSSSGLWRVAWRVGNVYSVQPDSGRHTIWYVGDVPRLVWDAEGRTAPPAEEIYPQGEQYVPAMFKVTHLDYWTVDTITIAALMAAGYAGEAHFRHRMEQLHGLNDEGMVIYIGIRLLDRGEITEYREVWPDATGG